MAEEGHEESNPIEVPEAIHHGWDIAKGGDDAINAFGLTPNARAANTVASWGSEAAEAGNATEAAEMAESAEAFRGPASAMFEAAEPIAGAAGAFMGGFNMAKGVDEMIHGEAGQGVLDVASGGLGVAAGAGALGVEALGAAACPMLAPAALAAGLIASGNEKTKEWGWFGQHEDENGQMVNRSATDWIGDETSSAYHSVDDALGGGVLGTVGGGLAGAATAIGTGVVGLGADLVAGIGGVASSIGSGIASIFSW